MSDETSPTAGAGNRASRPHRRYVPDSLLDAGLVVVVALSVVVAVAALVRGAAAPDAAEMVIPPIRLVQPEDGATVTRPIELVFETDARLTRNAHGWGTGPLHIHAEVDGADLMPGGLDIRPLEDGRYAWTLPVAGAGPRTLRMYWSGPDHRPIDAGATPPVRVVLTDS